jgi:Tat protein secretion system quality control protein TatD with DNase activity
MPFVDTHTHLYDAQYAEDRAEALARASEADVTRLVAIGAGME